MKVACYFPHAIFAIAFVFEYIIVAFELKLTICKIFCTKKIKNRHSSNSLKKYFVQMSILKCTLQLHTAVPI